MKIPDLKTRAGLHVASVQASLNNLPEDRELTPMDIKPILTEARTALSSIQYLHDLVSGQKPVPPPV